MKKFLKNQNQLHKIPTVDTIYKDKVVYSKCRILLSWRGKKFKFAKLETAKDGSFYAYHAQLSDREQWPFVRHGDFSYSKTSDRFLSVEEQNTKDIHLSLHPRDNVILIGGNKPPKKVRMPMDWYPVKKPWLIGRVQSGSLLSLNPLSEKGCSNSLEIKIPDNHLGSVSGDIYIVPSFVSVFEIDEQKLDYVAVQPRHGQYSTWVFFNFLSVLPPALLIPSTPGSHGWDIVKEKIQKL